MGASLEHLTPEEQEALRTTFLTQAGELLDAINEGLLQLEAGRTEPRLVQGLEIIAEILHPELFSGYIPEDGAARVDGTLARIG